MNLEVAVKTCSNTSEHRKVQTTYCVWLCLIDTLVSSTAFIGVVFLLERPMAALAATFSGSFNEVASHCSTIGPVPQRKPL